MPSAPRDSAETAHEAPSPRAQRPSRRASAAAAATDVVVVAGTVAVSHAPLARRADDQRPGSASFLVDTVALGEEASHCGAQPRWLCLAASRLPVALPRDLPAKELCCSPIAEVASPATSLRAQVGATPTSAEGHLRLPTPIESAPAEAGPTPLSLEQLLRQVFLAVAAAPTTASTQRRRLQMRASLGQVVAVAAAELLTTAQPPAAQPDAPPTAGVAHPKLPTQTRSAAAEAVAAHWF